MILSLLPALTPAQAEYKAEHRGGTMRLVARSAAGTLDLANNALTTLSLELGEKAKISATEEMEIMHFGLPPRLGIERLAV